MRQRILLYFLFFSLPFFSQVRLTDVPFEFKKSSDYHQLITNVNPNTSEIFTFASDKEKLFGVKFNSFLFFSDSLTVPKPDGFRYMMGCGFSENNNPISYWATENLEKFIGIEFNFATHTTKTIEYTINLKDYTVFTDFTDKGILYFLCEKEDSKIVQLFILNGHNVTRNELDFSKFTILDKNAKNISLLKAINQYGLTKIETKGFNSFVTDSSPIKYYLRDNALVITLDITISKTQIFNIDLSSFEIKETVFNQDISSKDIKKTNSLLFENYLLQLVSSKKLFEIKILNYLDKSLIKTYSVTESNPFPFSNTVLLSQIENKTPQDLKKTKRFLSKLTTSNIGASLYNFNGKYITTFGGHKSINRNSDVFVDLIGIASGYDIIPSGNYIQQNIFFDVILNATFEQTEPLKEPLYIDKIAQFTAENKNVRYEHYFPFKDHFILTYYDKSTDKIILSKFTDGFDY